LISACKSYLKTYPKRHILFEYVMLDGVNDTIQDAKAIIRLLQGVSAKVNLIPFNPFTGSEYQTSPLERVKEFQLRLIRSGIHTNIRKTRGEDIDAACGQLAGDVTDRTKRTQQHYAVSVDAASVTQKNTLNPTENNMAKIQE
jgi:23S rRNA (adenine2503-C2)-methyltransferase